MTAPVVDPVAYPVRRAFILVFLAIVATGMGQSMLFAVLAPLGREVGLAEFQVGLIISASSITFFVFSNLWGRVSDRWGRRRVMLIGLVGYTLGSSLFATTFYAALVGWLLPTAATLALMLTRMAQSSVMSATPPAASALVADITTDATRTRGMSYIGAAQNLGAIAGPALGGLIAGASLLAPIWCAALLTLLAAGCLFLWLPELSAPSPPDRGPETEGQGSLAAEPDRVRRLAGLQFTDRRILPYVVIGVVMFVGFAIVQQTLAFRMQDVLALSSSEAAREFGFAVMFSAASSLLAQVLFVQRLALAPRTLLRCAMPSLLLGFALVAAARAEADFFVAMTVLGMGLGLAGPGFVAGASVAVRREEQGAVAGITSSCPPLGFTLGPLIGTYLYQFDGQWPYFAALSLYVPLAIFTFTMRPAAAALPPEVVPIVQDPSVVPEPNPKR